MATRANIKIRPGSFLSESEFDTLSNYSDSDFATSVEEEEIELEEERRHPNDGWLFTVFYLSLMSAVILYGWIYLSIAKTIEDGYWPRLLFFLFLPVVLGMIMFPFKVVAFNTLALLGSHWNVHKNSKYHSAVAPPVPRHLPPVCVQMPVYKEDFEETIEPSLDDILVAIEYYRSQGGKAHMFVNDDGLMLISEEDRNQRIAYYEKHNIAYIARPDPKTLPRYGVFKKASNMNFCLNFALDVAKAERELNLSKEEAIFHVQFNREYECLAGGPISMDEVKYILLVDSDTRVPLKCLYQTVGEFVTSPHVGYIQHTMSVLRVEFNYWEAMLAHWTFLLYNVFIPMGTGNGEAAPLVGHNVTLNWTAVQEVSTFDEEVGYRKFWSESHVAEDFDMSMRLQSGGYQGRYALYTGLGFQEGVSITVFDEVIKLKKFAFGAGELLVNKLKDWPRKGVLSPLFRRYLKTPGIPLVAKVNLLAYLFTWIAMSWAVLCLPLAFYISFGGSAEYLVVQQVFDSYIGILIVFGVLMTSGTILLVWLLQIEQYLFNAIIKEIIWVPFMALFYGGVQWHVFAGFFRYLLDMKAEWGATVKELEQQEASFYVLYKEVKNTVKIYWFMYAVMGFLCLLGFVYFEFNGFLSDEPIDCYEVTSTNATFNATANATIDVTSTEVFCVYPEVEFNLLLMVPFLNFIGAHLFMPILLNPMAMRCFYSNIPQRIFATLTMCCRCTTKTEKEVLGDAADLEPGDTRDRNITFAHSPSLLEPWWENVDNEDFPDRRPSQRPSYISGEDLSGLSPKMSMDEYNADGKSEGKSITSLSRFYSKSKLKDSHALKNWKRKGDEVPGSPHSQGSINYLDIDDNDVMFRTQSGHKFSI